jgi:hypothetical protein
MFSQVGDRPWLVEYHYRGLDFIGGNLYIIVGVVLLAVLTVCAARLVRRPPDVPVALTGERM